MTLLLFWLACGGGDPALVAQRDAIDAWRRGQVALEAGDPATAITHFDRAVALRPDDGLLQAWQAKALADQGNLAGAIERAERALELAPGMADVRYNRAAWLARAGRPDEAGPELERALEHGAASPRDAVVDVDFAPHLGHPALSFLPRPSPEAVLTVPSSAAFWGSQVTVSLALQGSGAVTLDGGLHGPVELVSAVARRTSSGGGQIRHDWTVIVRGAGRVDVGPLRLVVEGRELVVDRQGFDAVAPPDKAQVPPHSVALPWVPGVADGLSAPGVRGGPGELVVLADTVQKVAIDPEAGRRQKFEEWREGQPRYRVHRWVELPAGDYEVVVRDPGSEALREVVTVSAGPPG